MKKIFTLAMIMTIAISANAMSFTQAKNEALFLSDKMAYELNLTDAQYDAVYEINLDYFMSINGHNDLYGSWWNRRNTDLQFVLTAYQYNKYVGLSYFYRPLSWSAGNWTFNVYSHYTNKNHFYKGHPSVFANYRGGNNKKANHYAGRNGSGSTWRNTGSNSGNGSTWRNTGSNNGNGSTWRNTGSNNGNGSTWRNTGSNNGGGPNWRNNDRNSSSQNSGHFGGSRRE